MQDPTPRQLEALTFIKKYLAEHKISPTIAEIATAMNLRYRSAAYFHVLALEKKGLVRRSASEQRGIEVL